MSLTNVRPTNPRAVGDVAMSCSAQSPRAKGGNPDRIKRRIIAIARRKGFKIREAWETGRDMDRDADD